VGRERVMNILGNIVTLRAIEEEDLPILHGWANDPVLQDILGDIHFPSSMIFHREWFKKTTMDRVNHRFAVEAPGVGLIGLSSIIELDWRNGHAHHGLLLGVASTRGKGYGTDAVMATMRYAFDEMHLERLNGSRIEYNKLSELFYRKLGWVDEGSQKNYYFRRGKYWDRIVNRILREEYYQLVEKTKYWG
jgi:RimJ/RimL family protein N-acetyltransferase